MTTPDLSILRNLMGNDETLVQRFIGIFKSQTPELLVRIREGIEMKDWANTSIAAHTIKSQCRYFGLDEAAGLAEQIELEPATGETPQRLRMLEQHLNKVLQNLA